MDIALDLTTKDLRVTNGDLVLISKTEERRQLLESELKFFLAEWFLNEQQGLPYFDSIFVKNPNPVLVDSIFKNKILSIPGMVELISFKSDIDKTLRKFTLNFKARDEDSEIIDLSIAVP